jgi:hypothetical protein
MQFSAIYFVIVCFCSQATTGFGMQSAGGFGASVRTCAGVHYHSRDVHTFLSANLEEFTIPQNFRFIKDSECL